MAAGCTADGHINGRCCRAGTTDDGRRRHGDNASAARLQTPLSLGLAKASLIAGDIGKFMLTPLGGIGFWNHLA